MIPTGMVGRRVIMFANGRAGTAAVRAVVAHPGLELAALVVHPPDRAFDREAIERASGLDGDRIVESTSVGNDDRGRALLASFRATLGISILYAYLFDAETIALFDDGMLNLHPSLLPHNRGADTNVWPIVDGTPAGVTLHYIDTGVDTGDIVAQVRVPVVATDTGRTLFTRLEAACVELFSGSLDSIADGTLVRTPQPVGGGSYHRSSDLAGVHEIDLDGRYTGRQLIDQLRAHTFPPHRGCYFVDNGRRVYLELSLSTDESD